ncbi:hypothetical protein CPB84DRAFT_328434 [Gymnopilus junonius]|uniref:Uncharacterized protein n=1 Tax=Gymnopilus junonius TaxID=109634 RepID=A0A9P5TI03_GYMJU|nr:hypothetical protein CPB84DRAFT_328434 [Gymnopilus junonius]
MHDSGVRSVEAMNKMNPVQFSSPRMPAAAPAKQAEMNLVVCIEEFARTFGAYMRCAAVASGGVAMVEDVDACTIRLTMTTIPPRR